MENSQKNWYDKYYKFILIIPAILIVITLFSIVQFNSKTGDIIGKDISLTGGTTITVFDGNINIDELRQDLREDFPDLSARTISDIISGKQQAFFVETRADVEDIKKALEDYLNYELNSENSSIEFSGAVLSEGFYKQLIGAIIAALLLMSWVVFAVFGTNKKTKAITLMLTAIGVGFVMPHIPTISFFIGSAIIFAFGYGIWFHPKTKQNIFTFAALAIASFLIFIFLNNIYFLIPISLILISIYTIYSIPSIAVIVSAFANIILTIGVINFVGMDLSSAGVVALLMLIGYSVDTDIMLTSRVLKNKEGSVNQRIFGAFKTGITMTATSIVAVAFSLLITYSFSEVLRQIFTILLIGLSFDLLNTWGTNASLLKWYAEAKKIQ